MGTQKAKVLLMLAALTLVACGKETSQTPTEHDGTPTGDLGDTLPPTPLDSITQGDTVIVDTPDSVSLGDTITVTGTINAVTDPCHGNFVIINIENIPNLGVSDLSYYCCSGIGTISFVNSIAIPSYFDWETGENIPYDGTHYLQDISIGNRVSLQCRRASDEDSYLFMAAFVCSASHIPPSLPIFIVTEQL